MKRLQMSFGASLEYKPEHPDRTARRMRGWNVEFQTWPNRASMAKSVRIQESAGSREQWKACLPLSPGEGY